MCNSIICKYSVRVFIIWLASIDLTACLFCMPFEIFVIRYNYTFSSVVACKVFRFLSHMVTVASGCLLTSIAIERYKIIMYQNIVRPVSNILVRGYFVNNAANPIVFCLLDRTFRQE
ncbi:neuropeptide Y receptor type 5-like [Mytilus edulis]|uniref:neuropeptide Y receptor type 5-like n=1 Tax=Mytilus edulis TaxID=6550 RepID=UPI0039EF3378